MNRPVFNGPEDNIRRRRLRDTMDCNAVIEGILRYHTNANTSIVGDDDVIRPRRRNVPQPVQPVPPAPLPSTDSADIYEMIEKFLPRRSRNDGANGSARPELADIPYGVQVRNDYDRALMNDHNGVNPMMGPFYHNTTYNPPRHPKYPQFYDFYNRNWTMDGEPER